MTDHNTSNSQMVLYNSSEFPLSQSKIQESYLTVQSILVLSEINTSFYHLLNTLQKYLNQWQDKYFRVKLNAFLKLADSTQVNKQQIHPQAKQPQNGSIHHRNVVIKKQVKWQSKKILKRIISILLNKQSNLLFASFIRISNTTKKNHAVKIASDKSSKIETNDSFKSKIFKRSPEKKHMPRKSYSTEKSPLYQQHEYYIPVKYQSQPSYIAVSATKTRLKPSYSDFFNVISCKANNDFQKHSMTSDPDKDNNRKMHSSSMKLSKRNEKIFQLQSLKRKYDKLMSEFNGFSERFLKVIEEEEDVK